MGALNPVRKSIRQYPDKGVTLWPAYLEMRGIVKKFPGVLALNRVNLDVEQGEIHALSGRERRGPSPR